MKSLHSHGPLDDLHAASTFAALGSEQRLALLRKLVRAGPGGAAIGELGDRAGIRGSTLTHHLKVLADAGIIRQSKDGRRIICQADYDRLHALSRFLLVECCADSAAPHEGHP